MKPLLCLVLTEPTLEENLSVLEKYRAWIDIAELRVDFLKKDEIFALRDFPERAQVPTILTVRRKVDGGMFTEGEAARMTIFARALAFSDSKPAKKFAYIDLEQDFNVPVLEEAAQAFGVTIIRSIHSFSAPPIETLSLLHDEALDPNVLYKLAVQMHSINDLTSLFKTAKSLNNKNRILIGMGDFGRPSRILAAKLGSPIVYTLPEKAALEHRVNAGILDPFILNSVYNFRSINADTKVFALLGTNIGQSKSPLIHNKGFLRHKINAVYIPLEANSFEDAMRCAEELDIHGLSVTAPFKQEAAQFVDALSDAAKKIAAINTMVKRGNAWFGENTDVAGFRQALLEFLQIDSLQNKKVSILGAGGAARAVAFVIQELGGQACVFNRSPLAAKQLADQYNFEWARLGPESQKKVKEFSDIIIQATSVGMPPASPGKKPKNPLKFYSFLGHEAVFDLIYQQEKTPLLLQAEQAGCKICNGEKMLLYQAHQQFYLFTGKYYEN